MGFGIAAAAKVGNAIGAQDIQGARRISWLILSTCVTTQSLFALALWLSQGQWPLIFTDDPDVTNLVKEVIPLLSGFCIIDAAQTAFGGILRGVGKQTIGAATYLFSYYVVGMSVGIPLALCTSLALMGLWIGITSAATTSLIILGSFYLFMSWQSVIDESQKRLQSSKPKYGSLEESTGNEDVKTPPEVYA